VRSARLAAVPLKMKLIVKHGRSINMSPLRGFITGSNSSKNRRYARLALRLTMAVASFADKRFVIVASTKACYSPTLKATTMFRIHTLTLAGWMIAATVAGAASSTPAKYFRFDGGIAGPAAG